MRIWHGTGASTLVDIAVPLIAFLLILMIALFATLAEKRRQSGQKFTSASTSATPPPLPTEENKCSNCRAALTSGAVFCPGCGKRLRVA